MYSLVSGIYDSYLAPTQLNLLVVGAQDSGKTTLLERCKVTEFPAKPQKESGNKTVYQRIAAEDPPAALKSALLETGAMMTRSRRRTLSRTSLASMSRSPSTQSVQTPAPVTPAVTKGTPNVRMSTGNSVVVKQKKRFSFCPAPRRYSQAAVQDEDDDESEREVLLRDDSFSSNPTTPTTGSVPFEGIRCGHSGFDYRWNGKHGVDGRNPEGRKQQSRDEHVIDSIGRRPSDIARYEQSTPTNIATVATATARKRRRGQHWASHAAILASRIQRQTERENASPANDSTHDRDESSKIRHVRCQMPHIRRRGRMKDLWERYYDDCDAVIFCWKLGEDPDKPPKEPDSDDDSDAEEEDVHETIYKKQQELLDTVRKSIPDDVPFLIMGHVFGKASEQIVDTMYNTDMLLPRYHNPMTGFCCSSAKTGAGVQSAMEWLIPLATRQQKERLASKRELDMMLEEQGKTV